MKGYMFLMITLFYCGISFTQTMNIHTSQGMDSYNLADIDSITFDVFSEIPTDGLLAYYPFNGNANDESGNGFNGVVNGALLDTNRFLVPERAYRFDGIDDNIYLNPISLHNKRSFSVWVKTTINNAPQNILFRGNIYWGAYYFYFRISDIGKFEYGHSFSSGYVTSDTIAADGNWHHLVATWDSTTVKLYFDGKIDKTEYYSLSPSGWDNDNVYIGAAHHNNGSLTQNFEGKIDDVRIYNRVLTADEVSLLFNEGE